MRRISAMAVAIAAALAICAGAGASAQRRVTPVKPPAGQNLNRLETDSLRNGNLIEKTDSRGNKIMVDTVTGLEVADTAATSRVPRMIYPLMHSASVGVDIWDPVMRLFGQHYGLIEFSGEVNLHNRYIPVVEIGLGRCDYTPANQNYTYRVATTPYFRIGCNYNFFYNSDPAYQAYGGIRLGYSPFRYHLENVVMNSGYWDETQTVDFPAMTSHVVYLNILIGIKVKISVRVSMWLAFRFMSRLHETKNPS